VWSAAGYGLGLGGDGDGPPGTQHVTPHRGTRSVKRPLRMMKMPSRAMLQSARLMAVWCLERHDPSFDVRFLCTDVLCVCAVQARGQAWRVVVGAGVACCSRIYSCIRTCKHACHVRTQHKTLSLASKWVDGPQATPLPDCSLRGSPACPSHTCLVLACLLIARRAAVCAAVPVPSMWPESPQLGMARLRRPPPAAPAPRRPAPPPPAQHPHARQVRPP
jgi:hypothetical protein